MRTCPKCGDFYADDLLTFCLADGTPLVGVSPHGESWSEGVRVVEEKERTLRKLRRRLRWRRVLMSATTTLVTTMIVCVVAVNSFIYLTPGPAEALHPAPSASAQKMATATVPLRLRESTPVESTLVEPVNMSTEVIPLPTPQRTDDVSPTAATVATQPSTPTEDSQPPPPQTPTPTSTPTPTPIPTPTPTPTLTPTPTPLPTLTPTPSPSPFNTPTPTECSAADKSREGEAIVNEFGGRWRQRIEGDRRKIIAENARDAATGAEASLGEIEYEGLFFKSCTASFITARYTWQVRTNVNGTIRTVVVRKSSRFACVKIGGAWRCN